MAIVSKEDIINRVSGLIGEANDDDSLALIEDVTDTLSDYETRLSDETDWKKRYEDNDAEWRKRYRERFTTGQEIVNETKEDVKRDGTMQTYEDLFESQEGNE